MLFNINIAAGKVAAVADKAYHGIIKTPELKTEDRQLIDDITEARLELMRAKSLFNEMTVEKAIDYAGYNLMAAEARYSYLLQLAKERNVRF
ncbi:MAG: YaaL family protein [Eubacteriales bacterium]|nr:YaaL family protein [Eubacteriales bacterium]MDD4390734.1 YaaL family protein [Eubacteriales bacterium]